MAKETHGPEVQLCSAHQATCPGRRLHLPGGKDVLLSCAQRHHMRPQKLCIYLLAPAQLYLVSDRHFNAA